MEIINYKNINTEYVNYSLMVQSSIWKICGNTESS